MLRMFLIKTSQVAPVIQFPPPELSQLCSWVCKPCLVDQSSYSWNGIPEGTCLQVTVCDHLDGAWGQVARSGMGAGWCCRQRLKRRTLEADGWISSHVANCLSYKANIWSLY